MKANNFAGISLIFATVAFSGAGQTSPARLQANTGVTSSDVRVEGGHESEASIVSAHPDNARREGDTLTISLNGRDIVRLRDNLPGCGMTCRAWSFAGTATLHSSAGTETVALISQSDNVGILRGAIIDASGHLTWFDWLYYVSPDGRYVASGRRAQFEVNDLPLQITDWTTPYPHRIYSFDVGCDVIKWTSNRRLKLRCNYPKGSTTNAQATFNGQQWKLRSATEPKNYLSRAQSRPVEPPNDVDLKAEGFERLN